jgi:hypothetical protein
VPPLGKSTGGDGIHLQLNSDGTGYVDFNGMRDWIFVPPNDTGARVTSVGEYSGAGELSWTAAGGANPGNTLAIEYSDPSQFSYRANTTFNGAIVFEQNQTFAELLETEGSVPLDGAQVSCEVGGWQIHVPIDGLPDFIMPWRRH